MQMKLFAQRANLPPKTIRYYEEIGLLQRLEAELRQLHQLGLTFPTNDVDGKNCVCHLVSQRGGQWKKERSNGAHDENKSNLP